MFRFAIPTLQLYIYQVSAAFPWQTTAAPSEVVPATASLLRGSHATGALTNASSNASTNASLSTKASSNMSAEASAMVLRHANYASECVDCLYKGTQCGCGPSMEYLACLTQHCKVDQKKFATMCSVVQSHCYSDLEIDCQGPNTVCQGKFHQLSSGGIGLTWDAGAMEDGAFCGPFGHCIGEMRMDVRVHNKPQPPPDAPKPPPKGSALPCELHAYQPKPPWLECGLPNSINADIDKKEDWTTCVSEVSGDSASCKLPMVSTLAAQQVIEAYCLLTDGPGGTRLTQPLRRKIKNTAQRALDEYDAPVASVREGFESDVKNVKNAIDVSGEEAGTAAKAKPPYMKDSDAEQKQPPPGRQIIKDVKDLERVSRESSIEAGRDARDAAREKGSQVSGKATEIAKKASKAKEPIVKEVDDLKHASREAGTEVARDAQKVKDAAREARDSKPPWMRDETPQLSSDGWHSDHLPDPHAATVVQFPVFQKLA